MKYRVHKIEQNYNEIWHGIKANKDIVVNYNFIVPKTHARCFQPPHHKPYVGDIIDILANVIGLSPLLLVLVV